MCGLLVSCADLKSSQRCLAKLFETTILEGREGVSNNFAKQRRDDFKIGTRDK